MANKVVSIRPALKWVGIPVALLGGLLSQNRAYRDYVSGEVRPFLEVKEEKREAHRCFFTTDNLYIETGILYGMLEFQKEIEELKVPDHIITPEEREFARDSLYDFGLTPLIVSNKKWNTIGSIHRISSLDINAARRNLNTPFSYEIAKREDYPIKVIDLNLLRKLPYSEFAKGLKENPKLEEAIKKLGLEKDPYYLAFVVDIDLDFLKSMMTGPEGKFEDDFLKGLANGPRKLQQAIREFGLEEDPYFSTFLD